MRGSRRARVGGRGAEGVEVRKGAKGADRRFFFGPRADLGETSESVSPIFGIDGNLVAKDLEIIFRCPFGGLYILL